MKYRIKINTLEGDEEEYIAQVRILLFWFGLTWTGEVDFSSIYKDRDRENALERIRRHRSKAPKKILNTDFEYL